MKSLNAVTKIVELLTPFPSEERVRVVQAAMAYLGEASPASAPLTDVKNSIEESAGDVSALLPRARAWMKQNSISADQLNEVFHLADGSAEIIAALPGKNKKEQTHSAYILTGIGKLLATGSAAFDDQAARSLCEKSGCYDYTNHAKYLRERGNEFTGTKDKGWTLTAPGLKRGAEIIRGLSANDA